MRNVLLLAVLWAMVSCNETKTAGVSETVSEQNLNAARKVSSAFQTGDVSSVDSFVADNFVDHTPMGDKIGRDSLKAMIAYIHGNYADMKVSTITEAANENYVFQWMKYSGPEGSKMGMPPGPYEMKTLEVTRWENGKAVEHWAYMDGVEAMKMSQSQPDTPKSKTDTSARKK